MIKIDGAFTEELIKKSADSPRRRINYNFHKKLSDTLQRMLNIMNSDTYVQPHKHEEPDKREVFIVLKGKGLVVEFNDFGEITEFIILDRDIDSYGCEIAPATWHTIICLEDNSIFYEAKDGPYSPANDKHFADWAPKEGDNNCLEYNKNLIKQIIGS